MNGLDPGAIARNLINYLGGGGGAAIAGAAVITTWLVAAAHWMSPRHAWMVTGCAIGAWTGSWVLNTVLAWA